MGACAANLRLPTAHPPATAGGTDCIQARVVTDSARSLRDIFVTEIPIDKLTIRYILPPRFNVEDESCLELNSRLIQ